MGLETLKLVMWIDVRIPIVEADSKSYVDDPIAHSVNPGPSKSARIKRPTQRVDDRARGKTIIGHLPQFLDAHRIDLGI